MKRLTLYATSAVALSLATLQPVQGNPIIVGDRATSECQSALQLAETMFHSNARRLHAPLELPDGFGSSMVLGAVALDISAGSALTVEESVFERTPNPQENRGIYVETGEASRTRLGIAEYSVGWRGDMYSLYVVPAGASSSDFTSAIVAKGRGSTRYKALLEDAWRPPLVFQEHASQKLWVLAVEDPYQSIGEWTVYAEVEGEYRESCSIRFSRSAGDGAISLLPRSVRRFAGLLDQSIGPGENEGTLQPTARLRSSAAVTWTNLALRPWALSEADAYNSADTVRAGLAEWAKKGPSYRALHTLIAEEYPKAEKALGTYYSETFGLQPAQAAAAAAYALDIAFRANYVFPGRDDSLTPKHIEANPWPKTRSK